MQLKVKGHSGCQIAIHNDGRRLTIVKSTHDPAYVARLERQALKQQQAFATKYQHIRIPEIFSTAKTATTFSMTMEYVYSKNFVDYFEDAGFEQIAYFIKALQIFLDKEIEQSPLTAVSRTVVTDKAADVAKKVAANPHLQPYDEVPAIMSRSQAIFAALPEQLVMPVGQCHGDLTYSNILFNGNNYYLIDFLDSFIESPLLDLVKVRQDTCFGWSQLMYEGDFDALRLSIISRKVDQAIDAYYRARHPWYAQLYQPMQLMNFLRVLQYAHEPRVITYLLQVLHQILNQQ